MNKSDYISIPEVKCFVTFFVAKVLSFYHNYTIRTTGETWKCDSIADAARKYQWPIKSKSGTSLLENCITLRALQMKLDEALASNNSSDLVNASIEVFKWGGVLKGNTDRVKKNKHLLHKLYKESIKQLSIHGDDAYLDKVYNMNSGFAKIYSLLSPGIIIYDSRVGAALGLLVLECANLHGWNCILDELRFPYAPAKEGANAKNPKNHNPGLGKTLAGQTAERFFPDFTGRPEWHRMYALRASWVIEAVSKKLDKDSLLPDELKIADCNIDLARFLEAGLFMIGYDLPVNECASFTTGETFNNEDDPSEDAFYEVPEIEECKVNTLPGIENANLTRLATLSKRIPFIATIGNDMTTLNIYTGVLRRFKFSISLDTIHESMLWLIDKYGTDESFELDNSADLVPLYYNTSKSKLGLGTAIYHTDSSFNPPNSSAIASVLVEARILEVTCWRPLHFKIFYLPTKTSFSEHIQNALECRQE